LFTVQFYFNLRGQSAIKPFQQLSKLQEDRLIELRFFHPTRHKIGHFGDVPQAHLLAWYDSCSKKHSNDQLQSSVISQPLSHAVTRSYTGLSTVSHTTTLSCNCNITSLN